MKITEKQITELNKAKITFETCSLGARNDKTDEGLLIFKLKKDGKLIKDFTDPEKKPQPTVGELALKSYNYLKKKGMLNN